MDILHDLKNHAFGLDSNKYKVCILWNPSSSRDVGWVVVRKEVEVDLGPTFQTRNYNLGLQARCKEQSNREVVELEVVDEINLECPTKKILHSESTVLTQYPCDFCFKMFKGRRGRNIHVTKYCKVRRQLSFQGIEKKLNINIGTHCSTNESKLEENSVFVASEGNSSISTTCSTNESKLEENSVFVSVGNSSISTNNLSKLKDNSSERNSIIGTTCSNNEIKLKGNSSERKSSLAEKVLLKVRYKNKLLTCRLTRQKRISRLLAKLRKKFGSQILGFSQGLKKLSGEEIAEHVEMGGELELMDICKQGNCGGK